MSPFGRLLCLAIAGLVATPATAADVVVLPLAGVQAQAVRAAVTASLRDEIQALGFSVLSSPATDQVLADAAAFGNACTVTISTCAVQMGSLAGGRTVVVGGLDNTSLTVRSYDVASARETGRVVVPFDDGQPASAVRLAAIRLLRPEAEVGTLDLFADVPGAVVFVDGRSVGTTPLPSVSMAPGRYTIEVTPLGDLKSQSFTVDIGLGAVTRLEVFLKPETPRPGRPPPVGSTVPAPIFVLDVDASPDLALQAALLTEGLIEEIRHRVGGKVNVGTPQDFTRMLPGAVDDCASDPVCVRGRVNPVPAIDVVGATLTEVGGTLVLKCRRMRLDTGVQRQADASVALGNDAALVPLLGTVGADLFPEYIATVNPSVEPLMARFNPPPLPLLAWAGTVGGFGVGVGVGTASLIAFGGAAPDDPLRSAWGGGVVVGAVLAAAGLAATIVEIPFVDWQGLSAENELLLEARAARYSSR